jgi:hypothetical protein
MMENVEVMPNASSVHTKRKAWPEVPMSPPIREDFAIRSEERAMAGFDHGHITPAEQRALNQQENAVSRRIGW